MSETTAVDPTVASACDELTGIVSAHASDVASLAATPTDLGALPAAQWLARLLDARGQKATQSVEELDTEARRVASELRAAIDGLVGTDDENAQSVVDPVASA